MKAAMPPFFCASAITWSAMVVLPDDSGPKISLMRPRGKPPTPRAASSEIEPVEITDTGTMASFDPNRRIEPLPNCFSIWPRARSKARARSFSSMGVKLLKKRDECSLYRGRYNRNSAGYHPNVSTLFHLFTASHPDLRRLQE